MKLIETQGRATGLDEVRSREAVAWAAAEASGFSSRICQYIRMFSTSTRVQMESSSQHT